MTFQRYESRPITRLAHEITEKDVLSSAGTNLIRARFPDGEAITFVHYEDVKTGDYIVYLNDEDVYHCSRAVFLERNIVPEDDAMSDEEVHS